MMAAPGCDTGLGDLAQFIGSPFGSASGSVNDLSDEDMSLLMQDLMLRFRTYLTLRTAIDFADLAPEACMTESRSFTNGFEFRADINCMYGDEVSPANGFVFVRQEQVASDPVQVLDVDVTYEGVELGDLRVDGTEMIRETLSDDGASVRTIDLIQDGIELDYEFRAGTLDADTVVFDYEIDFGGSSYTARVTNPSSPGAFVDVIITGFDGLLQCQVRNSAWEPGDYARGTCDTGLVFGLPDVVPPE